MSSKTKNLGLFKYDTTTDGKQVFSIDKSMNANWDTIDSNTLAHRHVTNCLLEVPQKIKLELSGGTLTLKAGSVITIPNGFEADGTTHKFDYVTLNEDLTKQAKNNLPTFLIYDRNLHALRTRTINLASSGDTPSSTANGATWYNTTTNKVGAMTQSDGVTWSYNMSLPIAMLTESTTQIESINQVFNSMGYIGATVWVDKGVKCIIPNGRNEDGSLKNIYLTTTMLRMRTDAKVANYKSVVLYSNQGVGLGNGYLSCKTYADRNTGVAYQYVENENNMYVTTRTYAQPLTLLADITCDGTKITSFRPRIPFRSADYNDLMIRYWE